MSDNDKTAEFENLISDVRRRNEESNACLEALFGTLNCPTCGGSGHVEDAIARMGREAQPAAPTEVAELRAENERWAKECNDRDDLACAFAAACRFIDLHVADPDITADMALAYKDFLAWREHIANKGAQPAQADVERDAARYRWLRTWVKRDVDTQAVVPMTGTFQATALSLDELDAAIDTAMLAAAPEEK